VCESLGGREREIERGEREGRDVDRGKYIKGERVGEREG
jgi:hypothetical protein